MLSNQEHEDKGLFVLRPGAGGPQPGAPCAPRSVARRDPVTTGLPAWQAKLRYRPANENPRTDALMFIWDRGQTPAMVLGGRSW